MSIIDYIKTIKLDSVVRRALSSLFTMNILSLLLHGSEERLFHSTAFFAENNFFMLVCQILLTFLLFTLIDFSLRLTRHDEVAESMQRVYLLLSYLIYALICMAQYRDEWFNLGMLLCLLAIVVYVLGQVRLDFDISGRMLKLFVIVCGLFFAVFVSIQGVFRVLTQSTPNFDFGIFSQMFYYMKKTLQPLTTTERDILLSHFKIHVSPIYYLFLPIYAIFPDPITLEICQAVTIASGVIPTYLICKKVGLSNKATAAFSFLYVLFPAFTGGCYYDLHENKFLAPLIMWLLYFIEKDKLIGTLIFSLAVCMVKEDAAVYVIFIALYVLLSGKGIKKGLSLLVLGFAYFGGVIAYLENYGYSGVMSNRYDNFIYEKDGGLLTVIKSIIISPANVIKECFETTAPEGDYASKTEFILQMLAPLGFLPVITKKYARYILLCPFILVNLMPDYLYQHSINFQYTYATGAMLVYLAILNYKDFTPKMKRIGLSFAACSALLIFVQYICYRGNYIVNYINNYDKHVEVRQTLLDIPEDASVASSTFYVTTCSQREYIYDLDHYDKKDQNTVTTDYVVLDLRYAKNRRLYSAQYENDDDYECVKYIEGWLALMKYKGE